MFLLFLVFPGEFLRSQKGKRCQKRRDNIIRIFPFISDAVENIKLARDDCESHCLHQQNCWGCSVDCDKNCQWNAIEDCGILESWPGYIVGDTSQKPGKSFF